VRRAVERVWPRGVDLVEPLGGFTNRNFKITVGDDQFSLRIGAEETDLLGIDRAVEYEATLHAAELGIAPPVQQFIEPEGYLVAPFIKRASTEISPEEAASLLRRLHDSAPIAGRFDVFDIVEAYVEIARDRGVELPGVYAFSAGIAQRIKARLGDRPQRPCHNDLHLLDFINDGTRNWIVDWEYAGMSDPMFDLACFALEAGLDADGEDALFAAYGEADRDAYLLHRFTADLRWALWGIVQQAISEIEFDFAGYADEHFERLQHTATDTPFRQALSGERRR
jgi:Ser/Thr protein kinase RdoA (MazF antagonist)